MKSEHDRVEELLNRALEFKPEERTAFLAGACGNDVALRQRVETLLVAADAADGFMETASTQPGTPVTEGPGMVIGRYKLLQKVGEGGNGRGVHGRADRAGDRQSRAEDHQAGHGHPASGGPVRG